MRITFLFAVVIAVSSSLFISCSSAPAAETKVDLVALRPQIQGMEDAFAAAEKIKDADGVAKYYSDDAISYGRGEAPASGKAAIKQKIQEHMAKDTAGNYDVYKVVDLFAEGNMVVEVGSWTVLTPSGEEKDKGHYLSYFEKRDGKYLCVRDMNVSSNPPKPAP